MVLLLVCVCVCRGLIPFWERAAWLQHFWRSYLVYILQLKVWNNNNSTENLWSQTNCHPFTSVCRQALPLHLARINPLLWNPWCRPDQPRSFPSSLVTRGAPPRMVKEPTKSSPLELSSDDCFLSSCGDGWWLMVIDLRLSMSMLVSENSTVFEWSKIVDFEVPRSTYLAYTCSHFVDETENVVDTYKYWIRTDGRNELKTKI